MKITNYKDLKVWQEGIKIPGKIYDITENFPNTERYGLSSQMRRSAVSIPSNIAEGFMRHHLKEYIHFLYISMGSSAELETQLIISHNRNYINSPVFKQTQDILKQENQMLMGLIKSLRKFK